MVPYKLLLLVKDNVALDYRRPTFEPSHSPDLPKREMNIAQIVSFFFLNITSKNGL